MRTRYTVRTVRDRPVRVPGKAPPRRFDPTGVINAKGSFFGDLGEAQFAGERSEPVFTGAAGEKLAVSKADGQFHVKIGHQGCLWVKPKLSGIAS